MGVTPVPPARPPRGMEAQGSSEPWGGHSTGHSIFHWCPTAGLLLPGVQHSPTAAARVAGQRTKAALLELCFLTCPGSHRPALPSRIWAQEGCFRGELPEISRKPCWEPAVRAKLPWDYLTHPSTGGDSPLTPSPPS